MSEKVRKEINPFDHESPMVSGDEKEKNGKKLALQHSKTPIHRTPNHRKIAR